MMEYDPKIESEIRKKYPLFFLEMNEMQERFIRVKNDQHKTPKRRLNETGNKCLTGDALIETDKGKVPLIVLYNRGLPFKVKSWDGKKKVIGKATAPFKKEGLHQCYRIEMSNGNSIDAADYHYILTNHGWISSLDLHDTYSRNLHLTSSEPYLSVHDSGVVHLTQKQLDFLSCYQDDPRLYGEQLLFCPGIDQAVFPSQDDVLLHKEHFSEQMGGQVNKYDDILLLLSHHLSTFLCGLGHAWGRFFEFLIRETCRFSQLSPHEPLFFQQPSIAGGYQSQLSGEFVQYPGLLSNDVSSYSTSYVCNKIERITSIPVLQEVYDFTVKKYHNYFADGLIHHNTGKTFIGIAEDIAHALGYRIWLKRDDPDYKVDIKRPNRGFIGCETMSHSVMEKIWPTLKELIPPTCMFTAKKNPQGQIQKIVLHKDHEGRKLGSEIYLRSYDQNADTFEGIDADWMHWDEPPPKYIIQAAERGKVVTNAPSWFTMTPLKEPYIYDEYSLKAGNMGGEDDEIAVTRGEIWENCIDWCFKCDLDIPENLEQNEDFEYIRPIKECPKCKRIMGFIPKAGIYEYLKTLDPEEREAREKGIWKHLSGLIYKTLDRDVHIYDDFSIPRHWMKIEGIDPHDARPSKYLFAAVSPEDIEIFKKIKNRIYVFDFVLLDKDMDSIIRQIKIKREQHGYTKPKWIVLDAKYGVRKEMEGRTWENELRTRGIGNIRLSQSKPGDVELGHKIVREYLKLHYSVRLGKSKPGIMFAKEGCKGANGPIHQMFNYQYNEKHDKPEEAFKDFPDIVRYMALEQPVYTSPEEDSNVVNILKARHDKVIKTRRSAMG